MAKDRIDRNELADKLVETASAAEDPVRAMAEMVLDFLMEAEVTQKIGAEPHERTEERTGYRNGHRERRWDTRLGTLSLKVPKVREGGYVPSFIEHRKRSEQALISVIQEAVVQGVSTRRSRTCWRSSALPASRRAKSVSFARRWTTRCGSSGSARSARAGMCGWTRCTRRCARTIGSRAWRW